MNLVTGDLIAMSFYNVTTGRTDEWRGVVLEQGADGVYLVSRSDGAEVRWTADETNTRILRPTERKSKSS